MAATLVRGIPPAPPWAVRCAWAVPLLILPSALWRVSLLFRTSHPARNLQDGGWYLLLLSVLSLGLGSLTLGLVQSWGIVVPRWIAGLGGRVVPARVATLVACLGASGVLALQAYGAINTVFGVFHPTPLVETDFLRFAEPPRPAELALYLPMALWGPLVIAVATNYHRRRTAADAGPDTGASATCDPATAGQGQYGPP